MAKAMRLDSTTIKILALRFVLLCAVLFGGFRSHAQTSSDGLGLPPLASYAKFGPVTVNLATINNHIEFPVLQKAGRGLPFNQFLAYDSSVWSVQCSPVCTWMPNVNFNWNFSQNMGFVDNEVEGEASSNPCNGDPLHPKYIWSLSQYRYHDPHGTTHKFPDSATATWNACTGVATELVNVLATDGSGYSLTTHLQSGPHDSNDVPYGWNAAVRSKDGTRYDTANNVWFDVNLDSMTDTNGNVVNYVPAPHYATITKYDTMGTVAVQETVTSGQYGQHSYSYTDNTGTQRSITVNYSPYNIQTSFNCPNTDEYMEDSAHGSALVSSIVYPDNSNYLLQYEATPGSPGWVTGRLGSLTLPTGGTISFQYTGDVCSANAVGEKITTPDGTWQFDSTGLYYSSTSADWLSDTTVTDPQGNQTVYNFSLGFGANPPYEVGRRIYQGPATGTPIRTIETCYNGNTTDCQHTAYYPPITEKFITTTLESGQQSAQAVFYNNAGLVTETDEYDFGSGTVGPLLRKTLIQYATLDNGILDRPSSVVVQDGNGNILAQTNYGYDETGLVSTIGTPQQSAVSGSRGNATTINQWVQGSTYLTKHFTYYDTGNVYQTTDVNGGVSTNVFSDASSSCGNAFPTSITPAIASLATYASWDCNGAKSTVTTDADGNPTSYAWDYMWRPAGVTDPLGNQVNTGYSGATISETNMVFNSGNSIVDAAITLDGLGRPHFSQRRQGATGTALNTFDSVETDYDSNGRPNFTTIGYVAGGAQSYCSSHNPSNCTPPGTKTTYDVLSRPTEVDQIDAQGNILSTVIYGYVGNDVYIQERSLPPPNGQVFTTRQYEYDGLGRLTSVCELTSLAHGGGSCGQTNQQTGYWTKYTYDVLGHVTGVIQNAQAASNSQQTRSFTYDGLGRMLSEANPETGTVNYTYDSDSGACATTSTGDMVKRVDQAGNVTCYGYDALHRITTISHVSGPNASNTPSQGFIYDGYGGNPPSTNAKGRLSIAYTCIPGSCSSSWQTAELFNYDARGEVVDFYEVTPHSGGAYHLSSAYWAHGAVRNLSGLPSLPMIYYGDGNGLDGEGRLTKVSVGSSPIVPVVSYNNVDPSISNQPLGSLLSLNFATTTSGQYDSDSFIYDKNTGRLTQYTFNVNGQTDVGNLTWNPNGSLLQFQIADNIPGTADSQSCSYSHDDLGRVSNVNCGSAWNQAFSYDSFGNINKTGNVSFLPGVYPTSNRVPLSFGFNHDSNGNVTYDTVRNYTWDAEGKMSSVSTGGNTVNLTYDAMGRVVEQQRGSSYTQVVYGPTGSKLALMNGQNLSKAFVPLPGGGTAVYNSSGLQYYRHSDHLGSSRLASTPARTLYYSGAYAPFGESYAETGTTDRSFTGNNEDTVPGLADFMFRHYSPNQGRWISPDPAGLKAVSLADPQSWNRYAYVTNRPLTNIDPLGLDHCEWDENDRDDSPENGGATQAECEDPVNGGGTWVSEDQDSEDYFSNPQMSIMVLGQMYLGGETLPNGDTAISSFATASLSRAGQIGHVVITPKFIGEFYGASIMAADLLPAAGEDLIVTGIEGEAAGGEETSIVYRGLAEGENPAEGLSARAPGAGNSPASHVAGKIQSQWISTTKDLSVATERFGSNGVVSIDLSKVTSEVVDISKGIPDMEGTMLSNWAAKMQEVLIKDSIPSEAISIIK